MNFDEYYKAREEIVRIIKEDLLGPIDENEVLPESPVGYYLVGKLYPRNIASIEEENVEIEDDSAFCEEEMIALGNGDYPSACGVTFAIDRSSGSFDIEVKASYYDNSEDENSWVRVPISRNTHIDMDELLQAGKLRFDIEKGLFLFVSIYDKRDLQSLKVTVSIVNQSSVDSRKYSVLSQSTFFQPEIIISNLQGGSFCEIYQRDIRTYDNETKELEMLYHKSHSYGIGHGCAVDWKISGNGNVESVFIQIIPDYEVLQMKPAECIEKAFLSMKYLATASFDDIKQGIEKLCEGYSNWIDSINEGISSVPESLRLCANENIIKCKNTYKRLKESVEYLEDPLVLKAFQYANEAMYLQRKAAVKDISDEDITWYPFQLAFFLIEIEPIVNPTSKNRSLVDLLWFPTGGGKTEAYLGIAAFTIFNRRLHDKDEKGVAVFMRYTLRLLSYQQFERASAMICAAEYIRRRDSLGDRPFGIGLWAGRGLTPNDLKEADNYLKGMTLDNTNPVQVKKCPWCGATISDIDYKVDITKLRMHIKCSNSNCDFKEGLPIHLVDEDIYEWKPSFIVGTVDKFARIAFKQEAGELLGIDLDNSPELIIQDELHLISGPLGTVTGLYEAAITKLCERNGNKPKIIASTATIRNAQNQINALYGMDYTQFPPQGIDINDSYFASLSSREERAGRKYLGIFSAGSSRALTFTRTTAALLFASRYLVEAGYSEEVIDSFWTETGYFNTLKELGTSIIRVIDSVQDRFLYLKNTKFANIYPINGGKNRYSKYYEMSSQRSGEDLGTAIQNELIIKYKSDNSTSPYDFIMASNMISVGVDVPRLNNMLMVGQPLKTSEYIQSTSRVGRRTPGLVCILYHPTSSRDRSYYEQFNAYHSSLYKYVESTSLTPFSDRARDRALQALYVILCRYTVNGLRANKDAMNYRRDLVGLDKVRKYIYDYVSLVDPSELENVRSEIEEIEIIWENKAINSGKLDYSNYVKDENSLFDKDYMEGKRFRMMNSMRSVEPSVEIITEE